MLLSLVTIFLYKDRKKQITLCTVNMVAILASCAWIIYSMSQIQDTIKDAGLGTYIIAVSYILISFARKYIKKDQNLVDSVDRIR